MQKVIGIQGFEFSFTLDGIGIRDKSFGIEQFNHGEGTYYYKLKSKVPVELHDDLKDMKDIDFYVVDNNGETFMFITSNSDEDEAREHAQKVLRVCKAVHNYKKPVQMTIIKRVLVEEVSDVVVV